MVYQMYHYRNYQRNENLIDLSQTPEGLRQNIIYEYLNQDPWQKKGKALPYLINKNLKELITSVEDFL